MRYEIELRRFKRKNLQQYCCTGPADTVIVIPTYSRPHNVGLIVEAALQCSRVGQIVVSNANLDVDIRSTLPDSDRVVPVNEPERYGVGRRWTIALEFDSPYYLSIDDDIALPPHSIHALIERLAQAPQSPVGIEGGVFLGAHERPAPTEQADCLWGVYAFTRDQLEAACQLAASLNIDLNRLNNGEDILLSQASGEPPRLLPDLITLPLHRRGYAPPLSHEDGFNEKRVRLMDRVRKHQKAPD